jgi:hypothetical protein
MKNNIQCAPLFSLNSFISIAHGCHSGCDVVAKRMVYDDPISTNSLATDVCHAQIMSPSLFLHIKIPSLSLSLSLSLSTTSS